jgi:hypothetical protein
MVCRVEVETETGELLIVMERRLTGNLAQSVGLSSHPIGNRVIAVPAQEKRNFRRFLRSEARRGDAAGLTASSAHGPARL